MALYVDTGAWIALREPKDNNHAAASKRLHAILADQEAIIVGWHTLIEFADGLARHYNQKDASTEIERILSSPRVRVEASEPYLPAARELFRSRHSWNVDLTDCLSFALMKAKGLERAFTYDRDFEKAGFRIEG